MKIITDPVDFNLHLDASIWDMDGTVLDTVLHNYKWLSWAYNKYSTSNEHFPEFSEKFMKYYNQVYTEGGLEGIYIKIIKTDWHKNQKRIWKDFNAFNDKNPIPTMVVDGTDIAEVIKYIQEHGQMTEQRNIRHRLAINTTKSYDSVKSSLIKNEIHDCFDSRATYDDVIKHLADGVLKKNGEIGTEDLESIRKMLSAEATKYLEKPNSLSSNLIFSRLGVQVNEAIVLEDTPNGIQAYKPVLFPRKSQSAYVAGVTWGFEKDPQKLIDAGADIIFEHPNEIIKFFESLGAFK